MESYRQVLNYSSANEDSRSEVQALRIGAEDSVLCITGSGARTLDLLIEGPKDIVSIDFNPCQNFLLELKIQAIHYLAYEEYCEFLGLRPSHARPRIYQSIRRSLSPEARHFWDSNSAMIENGAIYQGRWERHFHHLERLVSLVRPHVRRRLFSCENIGDQARIWGDEWDTPLWRLFLRSISSRVAWRYLIGDPGFYRYVPGNFSIYKYLNMRFTRGFENILASESPLALLLFCGRYNPNGVLPAHLQERHYRALQQGVERVRIVTESLPDYVERCKGHSIAKYSLSNFASYTNEGEYKRTWLGVIKTASSGARVCERQFLVKREIPAEARPCVRRDEALECELTRTDNSLFYTFVIATINGGEE